ncbi:MLO-like protein 12 [Tripterygium wilfordii]|uniref:MLO-like protein 12 n=1 Tax=Tripterygium wilfordii TaxID=458696 RepID=UPI0018F82DF6|nr:MLO-like protein 12 [Tripterygium wilfordii]
MATTERSLEETSTWALSIVCFFLFLITFIIDTTIHYISKFLRRRKRKSLSIALEKIKTEMMTMGFILVLLTVSEAPISNICVAESVANSFLPCKDPASFVEPAVSSAAQITGSESNTTLFNNNTDGSCKAKGMVSLISREGVMELRIFISVLAVFHVLYCVLTMCLGIAKMRKWKAWEEETHTLEYQIANDPRRFQLTRQTSFGRRHLKLWSDHSFLLWPVCFVRQFSGSASKADYFTLRNGFIAANVSEGSTFDFHRFLARAFDNDFKKVVEIRFWIWIFCVIFIFFSAHGFYNYFWLPFIPLVIVLVVGTKLEVIITKMCVEGGKNNSVTRGTFLVKPSDDLFWFRQPKLLLHLLQLTLIQNSFQLAFFTWTWYEYGLRSCFNREAEDIAIRITMGVVVQFVCGYVTLPLYALVIQMGSGMNKAIFTERVVRGLKDWQHNARQSLSKDRFTLTRHSENSFSPDNIDTSNSEVQTNLFPCNDFFPPLTAMSPSSTNEIVEERVESDHTPNPAMISNPIPEIIEEEANAKIITKERYDGEISFGSGWKKLERGNGIGEITSIIEEDTSNAVSDFGDQHTNIS